MHVGEGWAGGALWSLLQDDFLPCSRVQQPDSKAGSAQTFVSRKRHCRHMCPPMMAFPSLSPHSGVPQRTIFTLTELQRVGDRLPSQVQPESWQGAEGVPEWEQAGHWPGCTGLSPSCPPSPGASPELRRQGSIFWPCFIYPGAGNGTVVSP